ncbi:multidrug effflux MFS transporter [Roseomonas sp. NAR14]|uniref:Bcr/CflA family efflux transporter n=1 Tax=Roseomonas acroporae TaxID=2937791 RepID=A0A9X1Y5N7_9PROT|nr:multidrug effflux MFS transporter [Roseomonas acroporae]MCK8783918.1 multidrug effflux MFS transporter [Roseomonas acroporae]
MPSWLPLLLGFLTAINPISTDMYLPAFPAMEASLGSPPGSAQVTLAAWFIGVAIGQLLQGTLSDRFGRRMPLIAGTAVYTLASAGCALAPDIATLSAFRFLAAIGGSASSVLPRAVVRDVAEGLAAARLMSRLMLVMGVAPIAAPGLGGLVLGLAGWHAIFWVCTVYGALSTFLVWRFLPETSRPERRSALNPAVILGHYGAALGERGFLTHAAMAGFCMFLIFAYVASAPTVFIQGFGLSPGGFSLLFALNSVGFIGASQCNPWLLARLGANRLLHLATGLCAAAVLTLAVTALTGWGGLAGTFAPIVAAMAACGLIMPNAAVGALARHGARAGSASALMGTLQFGLAALSGLLVGVLSDGTARPMVLLMLAGLAAMVIADVLRPAR